MQIDHEKAQYDDVAKKTILENKEIKILYIAGKKNGFVTKDRLDGMKRLAEEEKLSLLVRQEISVKRKPDSWPSSMPEAGTSLCAG